MRIRNIALLIFMSATAILIANNTTLRQDILIRDRLNVKLLAQNMHLANTLSKDGSIIINKVNFGDLVLRRNIWRCTAHGKTSVPEYSVLMHDAKVISLDTYEVCMRWERNDVV